MLVVGVAQLLHLLLKPVDGVVLPKKMKIQLVGARKILLLLMVVALGARKILLLQMVVALGAKLQMKGIKLMMEAVVGAKSHP